MIDLLPYNSPKRLFELFYKLTGEDLVNSETDAH